MINLLQYLVFFYVLEQFSYFYHLLNTLKALQLIEHHDVLLSKKINGTAGKTDSLYPISFLAMLALTSVYYMLYL